MKIKEIICKSILVNSNLPGCDYVINPYTGCQHGCLYCYATFMKKYTNHPEPWGEFLDVKINAPDVLRKELPRKKKGEVLFSSVTDPYLPLENKYRLTRKCLEILLPYQWSISFLTKSDLVLRDIDLFKKFKDIEIGLSINTTSEKIQKLFEPKAISPIRRIETLRKLKARGIPTYAFCSPLLPFLVDVENLYKNLKGKIDFICFENLNPYGRIRNNMLKIIKMNYPDLLTNYQKIFNDKIFYKNYWRDIKIQILALEQKYNIQTKIYFH